MRISFRDKLLLIMLGLLAVSLTVSLLAVVRAANSTVADVIRQELEVAERVFTALLEDDREELRQRAEVLAGDFAFKQALATGERATMVSVLANHGERLNADYLVMLSPEYEVLLSTRQEMPLLPPRARDRLSAASAGSQALLVVLEGQPLQLVLMPVLAPDLIGWVGMGAEVNAEVLGTLRELTNTDITLFASAEPAQHRVQTTLVDRRLPLADQTGSPPEAADALLARLQEDQVLGHRVTLVGEDGQQLVAVLSKSLLASLENYGPLRAQMLIIGLVAVLLAGGAAWLLARSVTRPVYVLANAARRIANGNYSRRVKLMAGQEFGLLADTLNLLQDTVSEREARIRYQAQHDMLTRLPNRNYLNSLVQRRVAEGNPGEPFGMALLEFASLRQLSDLYGNAFSDTVLREVASRVNANLRRGDMAARVGDAQILLFLEALSHEGVDKVLSKLATDFSQPVICEGIPVQAEFRAGLVFSPQHGTQFDELLRRAQIALAQTRGANRAYAVYEIGLDESHLRQIRVAHRLQQALVDDVFTVVFQPKFDLQAGQVRQVEALVRWQDAELGPVYPDEFVPVAEQTGMITLLTRIVLKTVVGHLVQWREQGLELSVCVNLSGLDLQDSEFIEHLLETLQAASLNPGQVVMEITETMMMADVAAVLDNARLLESAGVPMSIDDFGTGFSSLAQLKMLPVRELKIDKSLVLQLDRDADDQQIVRSTIEMAHYLGLKVAAEGVENAATCDLLRGMGCDALQGYYLARPMDAESLVEWMRHPPEQVVELMESGHA